MKIVLKSVVITSALAATLATGVLIGTAFAAQPHMYSALHALQNARAELIVADADKGGHRVNAIRIVDQAIGEVNAGISCGRGGPC